MAAADLAGIPAEWVEPISIDYRGWKVYELPPNGQGVAALEMLNIMEHAARCSDYSASSVRCTCKIEAQKLAYADLRRYIADPRTGDVPVASLLSKDYASEARAR